MRRQTFSIDGQLMSRRFCDTDGLKLGVVGSFGSWMERKVWFWLAVYFVVMDGVVGAHASKEKSALVYLS
jgi:hypothetical protein